MARNDGIDRTSARNVNLTAAKIGNAQRHNEREKESYTNQDIIPECTPLNIHFKKPTAGYQEMFDKMKGDGVISTRGLKEDAHLFGELIFDVNSAYFYNHGGYDFAKQFYADAYKAAVEIVCGYARRRAKPGYVRSLGRGCIPLPPACGLYPGCRKADSVVEAVQR